MSKIDLNIVSNVVKSDKPTQFKLKIMPDKSNTVTAPITSPITTAKAVPLTNITNKEPTPTPQKSSIPLRIPATKRSTSDISFNSPVCEKEPEKISQTIDVETLAEIGRVFVDMISTSVEKNTSLNMESSMTSFVVSTFKRIMKNVKKT